MTRRKCPAARLIQAELECDRQQRRFDRTRSDEARIALKAARLAALRLAASMTPQSDSKGR